MLVSKNELVAQVQHLINMDRMEKMGYIKRNYPTYSANELIENLVANLDRAYLDKFLSDVGFTYDFFVRYDLGASPMLDYFLSMKVSSFRQIPEKILFKNQREISEEVRTLREMGFGPQHLYRRNSRDFTKKRV